MGSDFPVETGGLWSLESLEAKISKMARSSPLDFRAAGEKEKPPPSSVHVSAPQSGPMILMGPLGNVKKYDKKCVGIGCLYLGLRDGCMKVLPKILQDVWSWFGFARVAFLL